MKLKCYGCDEIVTEDMAIGYAGKDWCCLCHQEIGFALEEMDRAAAREREHILTELTQLRGARA